MKAFNFSYLTFWILCFGTTTTVLSIPPPVVLQNSFVVGQTFATPEIAMQWRIDNIDMPWNEYHRRYLIKDTTPEFHMSTPELIKFYGYPVEAHPVTTQDGYILTMFRIPATPFNVTYKGPVLVMHGLLCSSNDWLALGHCSLPFKLHKLGYDVWLGNARGNSYAKQHVSLSPDDLRFWKFSYHEMGLHDIPAMISRVLSVTNSPQLDYIGHSMGTTMFFICMDLRPELQARVRKMAALSPVAYLKHVRSPIRFAATLPPPVLKTYFDLFAGGQIVPSYVNNWLLRYGPLLCARNYVSRFCETLFFILVGFDYDQYCPHTDGMVVGHTPQPTSGQTVMHYFQWMYPGLVRTFLEIGQGVGGPVVVSQRFQWYDFGYVGNMQRYRSPVPPLYHLGKNLVDTGIFYANNDWLVHPMDAIQTMRELGHVTFSHLIANERFNHLDYLYAAEANDLLYCHVINYLGGGVYPWIRDFEYEQVYSQRDPGLLLKETTIEH